MRNLSEIKHGGRKVSEIIEDDVPDLRDADLRSADLRHANLRGADLKDTDLKDADLRKANLQGTDLKDADLQGTDLRRANLQDADLQNAYIRYADLRHADLQDATLRSADLRNTDLRDTTLPVYERLSQNSSFVAYKGCKGNVVKLEIPKGAERTSSLVGPKCRAECAEVLEVLDENSEPCDDTKTMSWYDKSFEYVEGERVYPDDWNDDIRVECTNGIHFYPTLDEAINAVR